MMLFFFAQLFEINLDLAVEKVRWVPLRTNQLIRLPTSRYSPFDQKPTDKLGIPPGQIIIWMIDVVACHVLV